MIPYVINHILFPIRGNFSLLTQVDVETIWLIENKVKVKWAQQVINYMIECKEKDTHLSYGNPITIFFGRNTIQLWR